MRRIGAILILMLAGACFGEAPEITTGTTTTSTQPTATSPDTTAGTAADSTTGSDPIAACRKCQAESCEAYLGACAAAPGCDNCVDAPFDPVCLSSADFRPLAFCSCEKCEDECGYLCPGGGDACDDCQMGSGCSADACINDPNMACFPCVSDPYAPGCQNDPLFMPLQACQCGACEAECLWQCPGAAPACASCLNGPCGMQFGACLSDDDCEACFNNPATPGCLTPNGDPANVLLGGLAMCVCADCSEPCGPLFGC